MFLQAMRWNASTRLAPVMFAPALTGARPMRDPAGELVRALVH